MHCVSADVSAVDIWYPAPTATVLLNYMSNISIWISPTTIYNSPGSVKCADNFTPPVTKAKYTLNCTQTITKARFVTLWKPILLTDTSASLYVSTALLFCRPAWGPRFLLHPCCMVKIINTLECTRV